MANPCHTLVISHANGVDSRADLESTFALRRCRIIINIGVERGIISAELFATLVIMAIVTTLMASPFFERIVGQPRAYPASAA